MEIIKEEMSRESQRVYNWRYNWLLSSGYTQENAERIAADFSIDWRFATELLNNGCEQEKAISILF